MNIYVQLFKFFSSFCIDSPNEEQMPQVGLQYCCHTYKRIHMQRVFLHEKNKEQNSRVTAQSVADLSAKNGNSFSSPLKYYYQYQFHLFIL